MVEKKEALVNKVCKFFMGLDPIIKFNQEMSHSFIPIFNGHTPFFGNVSDGQKKGFKDSFIIGEDPLIFRNFSKLTI